MRDVLIIGAGSDLCPEILALLAEYRGGVTVLAAERTEPAPLDASLFIRQLVEATTAPPIPYPAFPVYLGKRWPRRVAYRCGQRQRERRSKAGKP